MLSTQTNKVYNSNRVIPVIKKGVQSRNSNGSRRSIDVFSTAPNLIDKAGSPEIQRGLIMTKAFQSNENDTRIKELTEAKSHVKKIKIEKNNRQIVN